MGCIGLEAVQSEVRTIGGNSLYGRDVRLALLTCDNNHHLAGSDKTVNGHLDRTGFRHLGHTEYFAVLSDRHVRTGISAHRESRSTDDNGVGMVHGVGSRLCEIRHHRAVAEALVGTPVVLFRATTGTTIGIRA